MASRNFRDLIAWQRAMDFVAECYRISSRFPPDERYGLTAQLRRAAVSVPSNIAEGHGRGHVKSYTNHLWIANGSLRESETQLLIAERLGYAPPDAVQMTLELAGEVGRLITGLRRSLNDDPQSGRSPFRQPPDGAPG
ncbi:MAG: four helix bundle protein [Planctomycetaceae bacterium]